MSGEGINQLVEAKLFGPGKKRILALDGGGCRGIVTIAFLEQIETQLREVTGRPKLVLSDFFDMIGGTSVGSMLATMLALGHDVAEIKARFLEWAPEIFDGRLSPLLNMRRFEAGRLTRLVKRVVKEETLGSPLLKTGLTIVAKRVDTGSPWVLSNNRLMPYFEDKIDAITGKRLIGNRHYKLWSLIRASTAAPFLFTPIEFQILEDRENPEKGTFVDGGISPYNNPALQMVLMAGLPAYNLDWPMSHNDLLVISIGTGHHRTRTVRRSKRSFGARFMSGVASLIDGNLAGDIREAHFAVQTLRSLVADGEIFSLKLLQALSHPRFSWKIDSEIGTLDKQLLGGKTGTIPPLFSFQRYNLPLELGLVEAQYDVAATPKEREALYEIDNPAILDAAYKMAREAAGYQVSIDDFAAFL